MFSLIVTLVTVIVNCTRYVVTMCDFCAGATILMNVSLSMTLSAVRFVTIQ